MDIEVRLASTGEEISVLSSFGFGAFHVQFPDGHVGDVFEDEIVLIRK